MWPFKRIKQERWHTFISYTTRDDEVRLVKPIVDAYIGRLQSNGYKVCPVYYDGWYLRRGSYQKAELERELSNGIHNSESTSAFLSPGYYESCWCNYEWDESEKSQGLIYPILWKGDLTRAARKFQLRQIVDIRRHLEVGSANMAVDEIVERFREWRR